MISARRTAATVPPRNVARPPASDAPPRTAAVMLFSAKVEPIGALPIGDRAITKNEATAASTAERTSARTRSQLVLTPPRFADRSSKPTALSCETGPGGVEPQIGQTRPDDDDDEGHGDRSDARREHRHQVGMMTPWAVGRMVREIPSRMLNVARVAMIEGILSPRIRPALTRPRATPQRRMTPIPIRIWGTRSLGADQERGDDHPETDHAADGEIEVPDEERMGLSHRGDDQGERQDEDL